jgi:aflatoxin B1 aldehyde reductase
MYNALTRDVERELFPCLRRFNIPFFAYNPLAGGLLAGRVSREDLQKPEDEQQPGRFFKNSWAQNYRSRYAIDAYFDALDIVVPAVAEAFPDEATRPSLAEVSMRWLVHHSQLDASRGDAIIVGASSVSHVQQNLAAFEQPELPATVVAAFNDGWKKVNPNHCASYFR